MHRLSDEERFLLEMTFAEGEGYGMWYEYLAKRRVLPFGDVRSVLVAGLPEIYGLAVDMLRYAGDGRKLVMADPREGPLNRLRQITETRLKGEDITLVRTGDLTRLDFGDGAFDLVVNSEVLQAYPGKAAAILREMVRVSRKHVVTFVSNGHCYAHPRFSGLRSLKMSSFRPEVMNIPGFALNDSGYIDIPPWPSGIKVTGKKGPGSVSGEAGPEGGPAWLAGTAARIIPALARVERFCFPPFKQLCAHFIYFHLVKETG